MAEYLENTIFQKLSDFPFDLSVSVRLAVGDKAKRRGKNIVCIMT